MERFFARSDAVCVVGCRHLYQIFLLDWIRRLFCHVIHTFRFVHVYYTFSIIFSHDMLLEIVYIQ